MVKNECKLQIYEIMESANMIDFGKQFYTSLIFEGNVQSLTDFV